MGAILLEGGGEFGGRMSEPDLRALELAGGFNAPIRILPTAAAPDRNHMRAGNNGIRWFESLGARDVKSVPVTDKASANDPALAKSMRTARLIYLLGGFPRHLGETLKNSPVWEAALEAHAEGAVIAGSSAGAMVLCERYYAPQEGGLLDGLNLISKACVLPHHNTFGKGWAARLTEALPDSTLVGIDEQTGALFAGERWQVYGAGQVTLYRAGQVQVHARGGQFVL